MLGCLNILKESEKNQEKHLKLIEIDKIKITVGSLLKQEKINREKHTDEVQITRVEFGICLFIIDNEKFEVTSGQIIIIPNNLEHEITCLSDISKISTIYLKINLPSKQILVTKIDGLTLMNDKFVMNNIHVKDVITRELSDSIIIYRVEEGNVTFVDSKEHCHSLVGGLIVFLKDEYHEIHNETNNVRISYLRVFY